MFDRDTVRKGGDAVQRQLLMFFHRIVHRRSAGSLNAVDLNAGIEGLDCKCDTRNQSAAADRHDHCVDIGKVGQDFQTDGALTGDNILVVIRMDEGLAGFLLNLDCAGIGIIINAFDQHNFCAVALGCLNFGDGGACRDADGRLNAVAFAASATPCAWLPAEQAMTPAFFSSWDSWDIL